MRWRLRWTGRGGHPRHRLRHGWRRRRGGGRGARSSGRKRSPRPPAPSASTRRPRSPATDAHSLLRRDLAGQVVTGPTLTKRQRFPRDPDRAPHLKGLPMLVHTVPLPDPRLTRSGDAHSERPARSSRGSAFRACPASAMAQTATSRANRPATPTDSWCCSITPGRSPSPTRAIPDHVPRRRPIIVEKNQPWRA